MGELYSPYKVKDGIFAAMMDVVLVKDGPVGVDYSCLDGEVHPHIHQHSLLSAADHVLTSVKVTIQIDTDPPKMDGPTSLGTVDAEDLAKKMVNITKEFQLHPELLE